jgi:hypothetical protein
MESAVNALKEGFSAQSDASLAHCQTGTDWARIMQHLRLTTKNLLSSTWLQPVSRA